MEYYKILFIVFLQAIAETMIVLGVIVFAISLAKLLFAS